MGERFAMYRLPPTDADAQAADGAYADPAM